MDWINRQFKLKESGTDVRTEILAGVTTFMTMAYIIFVNPSILQNTGMPFGSVLVATCLAASLATFVMAVYANYPIGLAPGMGLNAFFTFGVVLGMGVSWQVALAAVFIEGIIFVLLTLTKLRELIINTIPKSLKLGISAGIGLFITFIGLQTAGIIVKNDAVLLGLAKLSGNIPVLLSLAGLIIMIVLEHFKVKGGILIGIIAITAVSILFGIAKVPEGFVDMPPSILPVFLKMDFSLILTSSFWIVVLTFFFVDFFDTVGTLIGVGNRGGMLDERGHLPRAKEALMADAVGTTAGAILGTSTVTSYIESASGVEQGGRTGLTALVVSVLFLLAILFSPLISIVPPCATAPALILVGIYMMSGLKEIFTDDWTEVAPAIFAFFMMPFSYSISVGIEAGVVSFVLLKFLTGKTKNLNIVIVCLAVLFAAARFFLQG
ncbi:MAG: NCS2 family permease [Synergistaceae bacterium]|nr:NCS2 family permease [Synergistaceae bacterium]